MNESILIVVSAILCICMIAAPFFKDHKACKPAGKKERK